MAVIADRCPDVAVTVVDLNTERIASWNDPDLSRLPVYEPGMDAVVGRCRRRNLTFSTAVEEAIAAADMVFLSVNTPTKTKGLGAGEASDLKWMEASALTVAQAATGHTIVVEKITLPVRTAEAVKAILGYGRPDQSFSVLSNPEFLAEGIAIGDLEEPDRVLIGGEDRESIAALAAIYAHWVPEERILCTSLWSSELSKLTANAFLAQRISSINSIAAFCEATGADVQEVARAIGSDSRIGEKFLQAGPGFGGSCFKKDILNLVYLCRHYGLEEVAAYWEQVVTLNTWQLQRIGRLVVTRLFGTVTGKRIALLGFAFKADTNDTRESPAIRFARDLLEEGALLRIVDPKLSERQITLDLGLAPGDGEGSWQLVGSAEEAATGSDALVLVTEWQLFGDLDWARIATVMRQPAWLFDARGRADQAEAAPPDCRPGASARAEAMPGSLLRNLVTGGAGFVGSHLVDRLMEAGEEVLCLDNYFTGCKVNIARWIGHLRFELIRHDVTEPIRLEVDRIWHLACPASPVHYQHNPIKTAKTSFLGTHTMLGLARRVGARLLLASTSEVYGDPEVHPQPESYRGCVTTIGPRSCYDEGKHIAETLCFDYRRMHGTEMRVARIFNTYGPRMLPDDGRVVSNFIVQALRGESLTLYGDGGQTRSFCYVDDLVEGLIRLMEGAHPGPINLGNPAEFSIRQLAELVRDRIDPHLALLTAPLPQDDPLQRQPAIQLAQRELGWQPAVPLQQGLDRTIAWFRSSLSSPQRGASLPGS